MGLQTTHRTLKGIYREPSGECRRAKLYFVDGIGWLTRTGWTPFLATGETSQIRGWGDRDTSQAAVYRAANIVGEFLAAQP